MPITLDVSRVTIGNFKNKPYRNIKRKSQVDEKTVGIAQDLFLHSEGWSLEQIKRFLEFFEGRNRHLQKFAYFKEIRDHLNSNDYTFLEQFPGFRITALAALCSSPAQIKVMKKIQSLVRDFNFSILSCVLYPGARFDRGEGNLTLAELLDLLQEHQFSPIQIFYACQKIVTDKYLVFYVTDKVFSIVATLRFTPAEMQSITQKAWNEFLIDLFNLLSREMLHLFLLRLNEFSLDQEGRTMLLQKFNKEKIFKDQDILDLKPLIPLTEEEKALYCPSLKR
jgi:hypothetical protein